MKNPKYPARELVRIRLMVRTTAAIPYNFLYLKLSAKRDKEIIMGKNKIINPAKTLALIAIADCRAIVRRAKLTRLPDNIAGIKMEKA